MGNARPLDRDRRSLIEGCAESNLTRPSQIGRPGTKGARAGGDPSPELGSRGGASPALRRSRRSRPSVGLLACGLAVEHERGMGNPLVGSGRGGIGRRERLAGRGGSGRRTRRRARVPGATGSLRLRLLVQKDQGKEAKLTEGCGGRSCGGRRTTTTTGGGGARALAGRAAAEDLRAPDHRRSTREGPVKVPEGLGKLGHRRR
jgi:hypothetical protein